MSSKPEDAPRKSPRVSPPSSAAGAKSARAGKKRPARTPGINLDQLGQLPRSQGTDRIFLVARDPHRLYCYWDIDISRHPGGQTFLRVYAGDEKSPKSPESEFEVSFESRNHDLPAHHAASRYAVEIGYYRGSTWHGLARSGTIETPSDRMDDTPGTVFTTVSAPTSHAPTLPGSPGHPPSNPTIPSLPLQHRRILETLLGSELLADLSSSSFSSEEISSRIRSHIEELLSSGGASELLASFASLPISPGSSENSASPPTLTALHLTRWAEEAFSSFSPESSWSSGLSGLSGSSNSSEFLESSWSSSALGSSLGFSSWGESSLSSLASSALSSWAGGSEFLSSPGQGNDFILHVGLEGIVQGTTLPGTKLTIGGQPVPVNAEGTFRYPVRVSDNSQEISLIATSPDGAATRTTTLRFHRESQSPPEAGKE